jgi:hypothetical protein
VTTGEPLSDQAPNDAPKEAVSAPAHASKRGLVEWFWRGSKLAETRRALPEMGARGTLLARRARASAELAQGMLMPDEPSTVSAEPSASELYRESAYWALCALAAVSNESAGSKYDVAIWDTLDEATLSRAVEVAERRELVQTALRSGSFVDFAELPQPEQLALCFDLRSLAQALIAKLDHRSQQLDAVYLERAWRLVLLGFVAIGALGGSLLLRSVLQDGRDLAHHAPWVTSSKFDASGCASPEQQCTGMTGYFFHTNQDESAWVEFDLGGVKKPAKVQVDNRSDCCADRANSIAIEVSTDHKRWKQVARHDGEFSTWNAAFTPVDAHWLRIRLLKQNYLHLSRVRIFP